MLGKLLNIEWKRERSVRELQPGASDRRIFEIHQQSQPCKITLNPQGEIEKSLMKILLKSGLSIDYKVTL